LATSGIPPASVSTWCFEPALPRSVGFGPVCAPQKPLAPKRSRSPHGTNRFGRLVVAAIAKHDGVGARHRLVSNRAVFANSSCRSRSPVLEATSPRECRFGARIECRSAPAGCRLVFVPDTGNAVAWPLAEAVRLSPTMCHPKLAWPSAYFLVRPHLASTAHL
jgi:hypothetical protein